MLQNKAIFDFYILKYIFNKNEMLNFSDDFYSTGVSIDTRNIEKDNLFVALIGEKQDAHNRVIEAFEKGASAVVINKNWYELNKELLQNKKIIIVENTLTALGQLAKEYRRRFNIPMVAIGGANGKTTTKEIIGYLLSKKYKVLKTFENFNNQLGLPLMIFQLDDTIDIAIFEIGTSEPGEIDILSNILQPTAGLITNIGKEHLEKLIDLDGVELEETALYGYLTKNEGVAFVNIDDERLSNYIKILPEVFTYGQDSNCTLNYSIDLDNELNSKITFKYNNEIEVANLKLKGISNALNAVAATAVSLFYNISLKEIVNYLSTFENTGSFSHSYGRMSVEKISKVTLINDTYNANPDSMLSAFKNVDLINSRATKIAILADMKELGVSSIDEHINVLKNANEVFDKILIYGSEFEKAISLTDLLKKEKFYFCENQESIIAYIKNNLKLNEDSSIILVKGSRSMKMENIVEFIKSEINN